MNATASGTGSAGSTTRWLVVAVALGLLARIVRYAVHFPIWGDEAFVAVNFFQRDFAGMTRTLEHDMVVPLGYLWATLAVSKAFGCGELALRLPALLAGIAALLLFVPLAIWTLPRRSALCAIALFAGSYYLIRHGAEVKPYASDLLVALPIYGIGLQIVGAGAAERTSARTQETRSPWLWALLALYGAVAVWCSYTAAFVAGGVLLVAGATVVRERSRAAWLSWLAAGVAITASFAAMYFTVGRNQQWSDSTIEDSRHWNEHFPPLDRPWLLPWWLVKEHTGNMFAYPNGGRDYGAVATTILVVCGVVALWRAKPSLRRRVALVLLSPLALMFLAAALRKYPYGGSARTTLHLAVPVCLLAGHGFVALVVTLVDRARARTRAQRAATGRLSVGARTVRRSVIGFVLVMLAFAGGSVVSDVAFPRKKEADVRTRDAIHELRDAARPGDRWIVFGAFHDLPHAPNMITWRGSSARLEYHLLNEARNSGVALDWAPRPEEIAKSGAGAGTWLLAYHDNESEFPESLWTTYLESVSARLGAPSGTRSIEIGPASPDPRTRSPRKEELVVVRFE